MKKSKNKKANSNKSDKKVKTELSKSAFDSFLRTAGNTEKSKKKSNKHK